MNYWLLKTEPNTFSIDDLQSSPKQTTLWEGVRNYQARNFLRDQIKKDDLAFFYHSSCKVPGIVGISRVVRAGYPDPTQFDSNSHYFDPKSSYENPRWYCVDIQLVNKFPDIITLSHLRSVPDLKNMIILQKGNRLSVTPVTKKEWEAIITSLSQL